MKTVEIETTGMHCRSCAMLIDLALAELEGVESVRSDAVGGTTVVTFDPARTSVRALADTIAEAGYGVGSIVE